MHQLFIYIKVRIFAPVVHSSGEENTAATITSKMT